MMVRSGFEMKYLVSTLSYSSYNWTLTLRHGHQNGWWMLTFHAEDSFIEICQCMVSILFVNSLAEIFEMW